MNTGFVKIYRKLLENTISSNLELLGLITALLLKANHKSNSFFLGTQKIQVLPGQFVSSQVKLSVEFGIQRNKMIRLLKILEDEKILNIKGYSKYSLFTMVNREKYQSIGTASDTANDTTNEHQMNTNNNDNNNKNEKKKNIAPDGADISKKSSSLTTVRSEEMFDEFRKVYPNKQGKAKAKEWYKKNITNELHNEILKGVQAYKRTIEDKKNRKEFAPEYKHGSSFLNQKSREDFTTITEEEAFWEAYQKGDVKIYSSRCINEVGNEWGTREEYYKPYNDLKSAILQKNNERDGYNNFISCYQTKWKK